MITIHHLENSRSQRVLWLLEELGLDYAVERYERTKTMQAPDSLKRVHPLGKSPILTDGDVTLAETGAIVEYILARAEDDRGLMPAPGDPAYWDARHFLHYAEGSAMPPLFLALVLGLIPDKAPFFAKPILKPAMDQVITSFVQPQLDLHLDHWEDALGETGWFAGDTFTAADIMMSFPVEAAGSRLDFSRRAKLKDFLARIHARPAYRKALDRGGPYDYA